MEAFVFIRRIIERQLLCQKWLRAGAASQFLVGNGKINHKTHCQKKGTQQNPVIPGRKYIKKYYNESSGAGFRYGRREGFSLEMISELRFGSLRTG